MTAPSQVTLRLETYSKSARQLVAAAQALADDRGHREVEPLHLLVRMAEREEIVQDAVRAVGVEPTDVLLEGELCLRRLPHADDEAFLSPRLLELLNRAEGEAARSGGAEVSAEHLLLATAQEGDSAARNVMVACGLSAPPLRDALNNAQRARDGLGDPSDPLVRFGTDLTRAAKRGELEPTVGRDDELRRVIQVLARRVENNPLLVGEAGVGKRAIVAALADRIARGDVPALLEGKRIIELDSGSLITGARLRGELEERITELLDALRDAGDDVILYFHSLEELLGERAPQSVAGLLGAALRNGQLRMIAVGEPGTVQRTLGGNNPLNRHFVRIDVEPPSVDDTVAILRGIEKRFELGHGLGISDPALVAAAQLAKRYIPHVRLPKSAIDLIDEAAALVRVEKQSVPASLDRLQRRIQNLDLQLAALADDHDDGSVATRVKLSAERDSLVPRIEEASRLHTDSKDAGPLVTEVHVAQVVAEHTGVPVARMLEGEADRLLRMEEHLSRRVIGQDRAVEVLSKAVRRGRVGLRDPKRPIGSFLFLGSSGVGKTELAKALAEFLFDDEHSLTRLDMSEFMEKHTVARLIGSPPGYRDSEEGGFLTEAVRRRPYSVLLFDEIEKAHPDVFNIMLQVLDDGRLTDSRGRLAHFADTVIIMTSNIGSRLILDHEGDVAALQDKIQNELEQTLRPEFLNRIGDVVIFNPLDRSHLRLIVDIQLRQLAGLIEPRKLHLEISDAAKERLVDMGHQPAFGARPLRRVIRRELQDRLAEEVLRGGYEAGDRIVVDIKDDTFHFDRNPS